MMVQPPKLSLCTHFTQVQDSSDLLQVYSKYVYNPSGKFFHVYSVFTDQADWDAYYPLIRAMLANWHAWDNTSIAVSLPETLTR